jgi:hypothetical protein
LAKNLANEFVTEHVAAALEPFSEGGRGGRLLGRFCVDDWCELLDYTSENGVDKLE